MKEFWWNAPFLAIIAAATILLYGMGQLISENLKQRQLRYEQCIAADKQWVLGSCVK
jgi:hypothetical protein